MSKGWGGMGGGGGGGGHSSTQEGPPNMQNKEMNSYRKPRIRSQRQ